MRRYKLFNLKDVVSYGDLRPRKINAKQLRVSIEQILTKTLRLSGAEFFFGKSGNFPVAALIFFVKGY